MNINNPGENLEKQNQNEVFEDKKTDIKIDVDDILNLQEYKKDLENIIPELKKVGLKIDKDGNLNFEKLKGYFHWPLIRGVDLHLFPSINFNKKYKLGDKNGRITGKEKLAELFKFLNFSVNENIFEKNSEEPNFLKSKIEKIIPELQELGLEIDENGRLFFENLNHSWRKIKINGKTLVNFPNSDFIKKNGLGNEGKINTLESLKKFFIFLGFEIIDLTKEEDFKKYYKDLFEKENLIERLKRIGLKTTKEGKLDLSELRGNRDWPEIRGKSLITIIPQDLNEKYNLGNKVFSSRKDLAVFLKFLGFDVDLKVFEKN